MAQMAGWEARRHERLRTKRRAGSACSRAHSHGPIPLREVITHSTISIESCQMRLWGVCLQAPGGVAHVGQEERQRMLELNEVRYLSRFLSVKELINEDVE